MMMSTRAAATPTSRAARTCALKYILCTPAAAGAPRHAKPAWFSLLVALLLIGGYTAHGAHDARPRPPALRTASLQQLQPTTPAQPQFDARAAFKAVVCSCQKPIAKSPALPHVSHHTFSLSLSRICSPPLPSLLSAR